MTETPAVIARLDRRLPRLTMGIKEASDRGHESITCLYFEEYKLAQQGDLREQTSVQEKRPK